MPVPEVRPATKLVCTLGPATAERVGELVAAGMSVARLNLSHGDAASHGAAVKAVRAAEAAAGRPLAILADLPGPKIRLGPVAGDALDLVAGTTFVLVPGGESLGDAASAAVSHAALASDLRPGDRVFLADGAVELRVVACTDGSVTTMVERGGRVRSRGGVSVPSERLSLPAIGEADRELAALAASLGVDFVGQSFVRGAADVVQLRDLLGPDGPRIVAKIETRPAAESVREILTVADAVMVARGDLGVELPFEAVPLAQLRIVTEGRRAGRPVIVATQMLESMTDAPRPTRAEVSDVANAVLDGADAVMLSGETAIGRFPVEAAEAATRIAAAAEGAETRPGGPATDEASEPDARDALAVAIAGAAVAEADPDVRGIVTWTRTGRTARLLAARRPRVPIFAVTPDVRVARALTLHRGIEAAVATEATPRAAVDAAIEAIVRQGRLGGGDAVVLVASSAGTGTGPNIVEIRRVDEHARGGG